MTARCRRSTPSATAYEVKLSLEDPDGGNAERILRMKTWAEPSLSPDAPTVNVYPGQLADALSKAQPGEVSRLHRGVYHGTFRPLSGVQGMPIGIVAAGDGEAILDGQGANNVIDAPGLHDVILENLTVQNARWGIAVSGGQQSRCPPTVGERYAGQYNKPMLPRE